MSCAHLTVSYCFRLNSIGIEMTCTRTNLVQVFLFVNGYEVEKRFYKKSSLIPNFMYIRII